MWEIVWSLVLEYKNVAAPCLLLLLGIAFKVIIYRVWKSDATDELKHFGGELGLLGLSLCMAAVVDSESALYTWNAEQGDLGFLIVVTFVIFLALYIASVWLYKFGRGRSSVSAGLLCYTFSWILGAFSFGQGIDLVNVAKAVVK